MKCAFPKDKNVKGIGIRNYYALNSQPSPLCSEVISFTGSALEVGNLRHEYDSDMTDYLRFLELRKRHWFSKQQTPSTQKTDAGRNRDVTGHD
jgi:hypothetical protein